MIKECFDEILKDDFDLGDTRKFSIRKYIDLFDEDQLFHILSNNGLVANDITIYFYIGVGFRCMNDERRTGRLPMCNIVQNRLNKKYKEFL